MIAALEQPDATGTGEGEWKFEDEYTLTNGTDRATRMAGALRVINRLSAQVATLKRERDDYRCGLLPACPTCGAFHHSAPEV
jgi:hypothetical protein